MKKHPVSSFEEFHNVVINYKNYVIFRGLRKRSYDLKPKVGRLEHKLKTRLDFEKRLYQQFKARHLPYHDKYIVKKINIMALGQHHGLPTRLMDWTKNPLVAAYFAVEKPHNDDSYIYAFKIRAPKKRLDDVDPFDIKNVKKFIPSYFTKRIISQNGVFTIHPDPEKPLEETKKYHDRIEQIIINKDFRKPMKDILYRYGIHRASLFPDLDGLSLHLQWLSEKSH